MRLLLFFFGPPCVREIKEVKSEKVETKPKYGNVTRFSKLLRSAPTLAKARLRSFASQL